MKKRNIDLSTVKSRGPFYCYYFFLDEASVGRSEKELSHVLKKKKRTLPIAVWIILFFSERKNRSSDLLWTVFTNFERKKKAFSDSMSWQPRSCGVVRRLNPWCTSPLSAEWCEEDSTLVRSRWYRGSKIYSPLISCLRELRARRIDPVSLEKKKNTVFWKLSSRLSESVVLCCVF